jgi:hypothetical protein
MRSTHQAAALLLLGVVSLATAQIETPCFNLTGTPNVGDSKDRFRLVAAITGQFKPFSEPSRWIEARQASFSDPVRIAMASTNRRGDKGGESGGLVFWKRQNGYIKADVSAAIWLGVEPRDGLETPGAALLIDWEPMLATKLVQNSPNECPELKGPSNGSFLACDWSSGLGKQPFMEGEIQMFFAKRGVDSQGKAVIIVPKGCSTVNVTAHH